MNLPFSVIFAVLAPQGALERAREALATGDYHGAWEIGSSAPDTLERCRARVEILYRAGDPAAALKEARAGLEIDPGQEELLYYATGASIWMEDGPRAVEYSARFLRAAEVQPPAQGGSREWLNSAKDFSARSAAVIDHDKDLRRAGLRLRFVAGLVAVLWSLTLLFVVRTQGKSSKPVS